MDKRLEQTAQEAAAPLQDDPELAREVSEELRAHLAEAVERYESEGISPADAIERALLDFGSPVEVAARLQEANRGRMRLRALIRLGLRWLAVPVAVAVACWLAISAVDDFTQTPFALHSGFFRVVGGGPADGLDRLGLSPSQKLLLQGDTSRREWHLRQRAIWESSPGNRVYFANYAGHLMSSGRDPDEQVRDLSRGFELDPQNSRYDYLVASVLLPGAVNIQPSLQLLVSPDRLSVVVNDQAKLERAMGFARRGLAKAKYRKYRQEMVEERQAALPLRSSADQLLRLRYLGGTPIESPIHLERLAISAIAYAELLYAEGRREEARLCLRVPNDVSRKLCLDSPAEVDFLTAERLAGIGKRGAAAARRVGDETWAAGLEREADGLESALRQNLRIDKAAPELRNRTGYTASFFSRWLGPFRLADVRFSRELDYCVAERAILAVALAVLLAILLACSMLAWLYGRASRQAAAIPMLLVPRIRQWSRIFVLGALLPIAVYLVFTRYAGFSGRDYALFPPTRTSYSSWLPGILFLIEVSALILAIVFLTSRLIKRYVRRRCLELRVPAPATWSSRTAQAITAALVLIPMLLFTLFGLTTLGTAFWIEGPRPSVLNLGAALCVLSLLAALLPMPALARSIRNRPDYSVYFASLYRSHVPVLAVLIIFLALLQPLLVGYEAWLVRHDPVTTRLAFESELATKIKRDVAAVPTAP